MSAPRRHAAEFLQNETDSARREEIFAKLRAEEAQIHRLPEKYRARIREQDKLTSLLRDAHAEHDRSAAH